MAFVLLRRVDEPRLQSKHVLLGLRRITSPGILSLAGNAILSFISIYLEILFVLL